MPSYYRGLTSNLSDNYANVNTIKTALPEHWVHSTSNSHTNKTADANLGGLSDLKRPPHSGHLEEKNDPQETL